MPNPFRDALDQVENGCDLTSSQVSDIVSDFLSGTVDSVTMRRFLVALANKGETVDELVGAARAMRKSMVEIHSERRPIVDTCGTGRGCRRS